LLLAVALGAGAGAVAAALTLSSLRDYYAAIAAAEPINLSGERPRPAPGDYDQAITAVREKVAPSAVEVFIQPDHNGLYEPGQGDASGFFITSDGWIATVLNSDDSATAAVLFGGKIYQVEKAVIDPATAVLFLKIDVANVSVAAFGKALDLQSGDFLFIVTNSETIFPTWFFRSVFISDTPSPAETVVRRWELADSVDNSFSGSAVSNGSGEVIGVLTESEVVLPIAAIQPAMYSLLKDGEISSVWFGATLAHDYADGATLDTIVKKSPAESAGLKKGDIILSVDGVELSDDRTLAEILCDYRVSDSLSLSFSRDGKVLETVLTLGSK
jgi:S1-C subfamily serine protease